jgi:UDP-glucose 4-epimerase
MGVFNVGGGSRIGLADVIEHIRHLSARPVEVRHLPAQDGDVRDTGADTRLASDRLGFRPNTPFADGLRAEFEWVVSTMQRSGLSR